MRQRRPRYKTYTQGDYVDTLYQAVLASRHDAVESLLDGGVSPDVRRGMHAPLHIAVSQADTRMAALLIAFGADVDARCTARNLTPLMEAAAQEDTTLCRLLLDAGCAIDAVDDTGMSALMIAVVEGNVAVTTLLVDAGANMFVHNTGNHIAYDLAIRHGQSECAAILYETMRMSPVRRPQTLRAPRVTFGGKKHG